VYCDRRSRGPDEASVEAERVVSTRVSLICAGWLPQDGTFELERIAGV
jgi:hypothetical protein